MYINHWIQLSTSLREKQLTRIFSNQPLNLWTRLLRALRTWVLPLLWLCMPTTEVYPTIIESLHEWVINLYYSIRI